MDGRDPGDFFKTVTGAAKDFGKYYNGASILRGKEFGSSIYVTTKDGKTGYSYSEASEGTGRATFISEPPNGEKVVADIHSHGKYLENSDNVFNNHDKTDNYNKKIDGYLTTPNGSLQKYDVETAKTTTISTDLQSDPKDPNRMNKNDPVDMPANKQSEMKKKEEEIKSEYRGTYGGQRTIEP